MAANVLGDPVEFWDIEKMQALAEETSMPFPPTDYWTYVPNPAGLRYGTSRRDEYTRDKLNGVPVDDDLAYTLLGLLIMEEFGPELSVEKIGEAWVKYLPRAATAEGVALRNLKAGVPASEAAITNNLMREWIGADIRSDPWGYVAPGWPEKAAELAYQDAYISHRATGIHVEMFFSAAIAAAFAVDDHIEAVKIGLTEIPKDCRTTQCVKEALKWCAKDKDWDKTTQRILEKYADMSMAHTLNNAALTVAGLYYGERNFQKTIALTVMGGVDTDCTGATAGSLLGAVLGAKRLPKKWIAPLGKRAESYINGHRWWRHEQIAKRFGKVARKVLGS